MISGAIQIIRPLNCTVAMLTLLLSQYILFNDLKITSELILASITTFLACAGGNALNDYYDYAVDMKHKKYRPIPSKKITKIQAIKLSILLFISALMTASLTNLKFLALTTVIIVLLYYYDKHSKKIGYLKDIMSAILTAIVLIAPLTIGLKTDLILIIIIFLASLSRELLKDLEEEKKLILNSGTPLTLMVLSYILSFTYFTTQPRMLLNLLLIVPLIIIYKSTRNKDYHTAQKTAKKTMILFLLLMIARWYL